MLIDETGDPLVGQVLAERYRIDRKLGEGGMGAVYLARHLVLDKEVALKVLHAELARKPELCERFLQEARAASRIRHENVIDITDFGTLPSGQVFFAMELLDGRDLQAEMAAAAREGGRLPWARSRAIFLQVCAALSAAHRAGILHRDLKPENIYLVEWLGHRDFVKLLDFGLAKSTEVPEEGRKLTRTGMLFGTPEYMSPEQARGEKPDARVDVYAMGCILHQLVTGRVPFEADSFMAVLSLHLSQPPPPVGAALAEVGAPAAIEQVIHTALAKDRDRRYPSIDALADAVRGADESARPRRPSEAVPPASAPVPQPRGDRRIFWVLLALMVLGSAGMAIAILGPGAGDGAEEGTAPALDAGAAASEDRGDEEVEPEAQAATPAPDASPAASGAADPPRELDRRGRPTPRRPRPTAPASEASSPSPSPSGGDDDEPTIGDVKPKDPFD